MLSFLVFEGDRPQAERVLRHAHILGPESVPISGEVSEAAEKASSASSRMIACAPVTATMRPILSLAAFILRLEVLLVGIALLIFCRLDELRGACRRHTDIRHRRRRQQSRFPK